MSTTSVEGLTSLTGEFDVLVQPSVYDSDSDGNSSVVSDSVFSLRCEYLFVTDLVISLLI